MIRPDRWIKRKSMPPTHLIYTQVDGRRTETLAWEGNTHTKEQLEDLESRFWASRLTPKQVAELGFLPMIEPFEPGQVRAMDPNKYNSMLDDMCDAGALIHQLDNPNGSKIISYGTSSYGYDVRCADEFKIFTNINSAMLDPKNFSDKVFVDHIGEYCIIPPNSFVLARTMEYFRIPRNVLVVCLGKSTYARIGLVCNVTPLEPEWCGHITLEFSNTTNLPAKLYANEGCAQLLFFESDEECETSYKDRGGKYMDQRGVNVPRM